MEVGSLPIADLLSMAASASLPSNSGQQPPPIQTPQPMTSMGPAPLTMPPPQPQIQPAPSGKQPTSFPSTGAKKRSDQQTMFSSLANVIKSGGDYVQAKKNRTLQMSIERLMSAQQGLEEAKSNPDDPKSKEAIAHNTAIINDITADPKINKQLQKAFNIDLFGGGKNKNENKALIEAWKGFNEKQKSGDKTALNPMAQRLMQGQPIHQQLDPQVMMQAQLIKMGINPTANEVLKAGVEHFKAITTATSSTNRNVALEQAAKDRADAIKYHADKVYDAVGKSNLSRENVADINRRSRKYVADSQAKEWDKRIDILRKQSTTNPVLKSLYNEANSINTEMKSLIGEITKNQTELDKKGSSFMGYKFGASSDAQTKTMTDKISIDNLRLNTLQAQLDQTRQKMQQLNQMGLLAPHNDSNTPNESQGGSEDPEKLFITPEGDDTE